MHQLLLLEDDANLAADIRAQLEREGFQVEVRYDGLMAEKTALRQSFDCIILDINVPGKNGYEVCRSIRNAGIPTPVIMLTAFGEVDDKLDGFDSGADDYLTKPFYFRELLARIKALLKRGGAAGATPKVITIDTLEIDTDKKQVSRAGQTLHLTGREFNILSMLAAAPGQPVSKKELISAIWGTSVEVNTNTIEVFINSLRNKIDKNQPVKLIHTRFGFGYYISTTSHEAS
ncbi:response regulator transcription factor [Chitinophaga sedimenti]|uniref:response regulator transcription factor n=1 Tax=Chitinophaga sedimenti TaxID=2033606 RepID=UPI00200477C9|nr:response regulator transcription factor [Chitinophaga sedimenti]MCK7558366.1 response regulator transcription factor [Chitinophaga sedimenti]